jgi:hypothetical protein
LDKRSIQFDFALSFAGEDREVAEALAQYLKASGARVFYDHFFRSHLLGKKLGDEWHRIYGKGTRFFVPLISRHYAKKYFPLSEFWVAKEEASRRTSEFILPIRLDGTLFPGLDADICYVDAREQSMDAIARVLLDKLGGITKLEDWAPTTYVATFGIAVDEVLETWDIPVHVSDTYWSLCDWFEKDLDRRLRAAGLGNLTYPESSSRNGETLSVRIAFDLSDTTNPMNFGDLAWWELLELAPWAEVYEQDHTK